MGAPTKLPGLKAGYHVKGETERERNGPDTRSSFSLGDYSHCQQVNNEHCKCENESWNGVSKYKFFAFFTGSCLIKPSSRKVVRGEREFAGKGCRDVED
jgi:hypothetical protein